MTLSSERGARNRTAVRNVSSHLILPSSPYPRWVLGQNESYPAQLEHSADLISRYVTGNTSCNKFILFYIYVVVHHCSTLLMGKQIMNSVITMTNNKQGYLFLVLKEINQTEVAFPALPSTLKSICNFQNSTSSPRIKTNYTNTTENFYIFQYLLQRM